MNARATKQLDEIAAKLAKLLGARSLADRSAVYSRFRLKPMTNGCCCGGAGANKYYQVPTVGVQVLVSTHRHTLSDPF